MQTRHVMAMFAATALLLGACSSDGDDTADGSGPQIDEELAVNSGEAFPEERCEANEAAGTITYLTGFDFAATASIVDILVADANGYYDELCLDVDVRAGGSAENYPLVASGNAQFASGGSFSEVVEFSAANDADFVAVAVEGRTPIDSLIVRPQEAASLADLAGTTIGVKFKMPPSIEAMLLSTEGFVKEQDFATVNLDGFDPLAHWAIEDIVGFPGYQSNEPGALARADIDFDLYVPQDYDIPGSFGVIYTTQQFIDEHPTAAQDFVRATMRGLADSIDDPAAAAQVSIDLINQNGNPMFLSPEGEVFRWETDARLISDTTPEGTGYGVPDASGLQDELKTYSEIGVFGDLATPEAAAHLDNAVIDGVYDAGGVVIWPA